MPVDPQDLYNDILAVLRQKYPEVYAKVLAKNSGAAAQVEPMLLLIAAIAEPIAARISSEGGGGGGGSAFVEHTEYRTVTNVEATNKVIILATTPITASNVKLDLIGGGPQIYAVDFTVVGNQIQWSSLGLDGLLGAGDQVRITYWST